MSRLLNTYTLSTEVKLKCVKSIFNVLLLDIFFLIDKRLMVNLLKNANILMWFFFLYINTWSCECSRDKMGPVKTLLINEYQ